MEDIHRLLLPKRKKEKGKKGGPTMQFQLPLGVAWRWSLRDCAAGVTWFRWIASIFHKNNMGLHLPFIYSSSVLPLSLPSLSPSSHNMREGPNPLPDLSLHPPLFTFSPSATLSHPHFPSTSRVLSFKYLPFSFFPFLFSPSFTLYPSPEKNVHFKGMIKYILPQ